MRNGVFVPNAVELLENYFQSQVDSRVPGGYGRVEVDLVNNPQLQVAQFTCSLGVTHCHVYPRSMYQQYEEDLAELARAGEQLVGQGELDRGSDSYRWLITKLNY